MAITLAMLAAAAANIKYAERTQEGAACLGVLHLHIEGDLFMAFRSVKQLLDGDAEILGRFEDPW